MIRAGVCLVLVLIGALCPALQIAEQTAHDVSREVQEHVDRSRGALYAGDAACLSCHREQGDSYLRTPHHLTSQSGSRDSILGSFQEGANLLMIADPATSGDSPGLSFKMEARADGFYETAIAGWPGQLQKRSERIDVVIGSGVRGQSYLYWHGDQLYELPVSYWSDGKQWINSPGYKNGTMNFSRAVTPRCLECHTSFIQPRSLDPMTNHYDKESLVVGISCERCHGPGASHTAMRRMKTAVSSISPQAEIQNPARWTRDRQVDMCALCHNGIKTEENAPAFSFVPGSAMGSYFQSNDDDSVVRPDVHGNQVGLLKKSRCYLSSPAMSCSTCHDVHAPERPAASYSSRCLSCHKVQSCGMAKTMGEGIAGNCIDCHMPVERTSALDFETTGRSVQPKMRNHWIKVYREPEAGVVIHPESVPQERAQAGRPGRSGNQSVFR